MGFRFASSHWIERLAIVAFLAAAAGSPPAMAQGANPILPGNNGGKEPIHINSSSVEYLPKEHRGLYAGGVLATQGDTTLKASTLTVFLNDQPGADNAAPSVGAAGGNQIRRIEAVGPVVITSKTQVATANSAIYDHAANSLTLLGNVTLSDGGNISKGGKLVYDLTSGRAILSGGTDSIITPGQTNNNPAPKPKPAPPKLRKAVDPVAH